MPITAQNMPHALESSSEVAWFVLITITPVGNPVIRFVNNTEKVISRGLEFIPYPFDIVLPQDDGETLPRVTLRIDNLSGEIMTAIRAQEEPPAVKIEVVTSAFPDIVEKSLDFLTLRTVSYDSLVVEGSLETTNILNMKFPKSRYLAVEFPALFY